MNYQEVLSFWFNELKPNQWFTKSEDLDRQMRERFLDLHGQASRCELWAWRESLKGRLAEILLLDQFSRNLYRNDPRSFAQDTLALALAQEALSHGSLDRLTLTERSFLYMPFMHSESLLMHLKAVELFSEPGLEYNLDYEIRHKQIIERFGRYPHRNQILGRPSTLEEIEFLKLPGSGF